MNTIQRKRYQELHRTKLQKELDEMGYRRIQQDLPVVTVKQPKRPVRIWAIAFGTLLIGSIAISQAF